MAMSSSTSGSGASMRKMSQQEYENRRSWLIDTAETPQQKKTLPNELAKLDRYYKRTQGGIGTNANKNVNPVYRNMGQ